MIKKQLERLMRIQKNTDRETFLFRAMSGKLSADAVSKGIKRYKFPDEMKELYVVLFCVHDCGVLADSTEEDPDIAYFALGNVFEELLTFAQVSFCAADGIYACAVCSQKTDSISALCGKIRKSLLFLNRNLGLEFTAAVSADASRFEDIKHLYGQAVEAMSYRFLAGAENVLVYGELMEETTVYSYGAEDRKKLRNSLDAADSYGASRLINQIVHNYRTSANISLNMMKMLLAEIAGTLIDFSLCLGRGGEPAATEVSHKIMSLADWYDLEDVLSDMIAYAEKLCEISVQKRKSPEDVRMANIREYIESHFTNPALTVRDVADEFGLSMNYLSSYFKRYASEGIAEYIVKLRIEKAKTLLEQTRHAVGVIAEEVGFFSSPVFIRAFKKQEGITPG